MVISYFNYLWDIEGVSAGSAVKAKEFVRAIRHLGHTVHLEWRTAQPSNGQARLSENLKQKLKPGLQKYLHEPKRLVKNLPHLLAEYNLLKSQAPDIFFNRLEIYQYSGTILSRWLDIPMVVEVDCPATYEHMSFYGKDYMHLGNLAQTLELKTLAAAEALIVITNALKKHFLDLGVPEEKMHVISNGADPEKFRPREKPHDLVEKHNLQGKVVIGWVGAAAGWEGVENMLPLVQEILGTFPDAAFMMVGGGPNKQLFEKKFGDTPLNDRIVLTGTVPHDTVPDYLACMDIVLAPYPSSFWYTSPMKIFEYMSAGKAIIASDFGQISEVIVDGKNGLLIEPANIRQLIARTTQLLENSVFREQLAAQARQDVLQNHTWEHKARQMIAVFGQVLAKRQRQPQEAVTAA